MSEEMIQRLKNPWFWVGVGSAVIAASGVDAQSLVEWGLLGDALVSIIENPVKFWATILAIVGVVNNPTTPGLKD